MSNDPYANAFLSGLLPGVQQSRQQWENQQRLKAQQANFDKEFAAQQAAQQFAQRMRERQVAAGEKTAGLRNDLLSEELAARPVLREREAASFALNERVTKSKLADADLARRIRKEELERIRGLREARGAAKSSGTPTKFTRGDIQTEEGLRGVFQRIDAMPVKDTYKEKLKQSAANTAKYLETTEFLSREFENLKDIAGVEGFATMIGGIPLLGRAIPGWRTDADKFEKFKGYLVKLGTQLQQSEPNNQQLQAAAQALLDVSPLDSDKSIEQQLGLIKDVLKSRQKESEMMLVGEGLLGDRNQPISGPSNFKVLE